MGMDAINALINGEIFDYCVIDYDDEKFIEKVTIYESESRKKIKKRVHFVLDYNGNLLEMKTI